MLYKYWLASYVAREVSIVCPSHTHHIATMSMPIYTTTGMSAQAAAAVAQRGTPSTLNLDDIFGDDWESAGK